MVTIVDASLVHNFTEHLDNCLKEKNKDYVLRILWFQNEGVGHITVGFFLYK